MSTSLKVLKVIGVIAVIYCMIWVEVFSRSKEQFSKAEESYRQGDMETASIHYSRALRMYGPGISYNRRSIDKLLAIAQQYESQKDIENALNTYEELAAAIRVIRSFYNPYYEIEMDARKMVQAMEPTVIQIQEERRKREEAEWRANQEKQNAQSPAVSVPTPVPTPGLVEGQP